MTTRASLIAPAFALLALAAIGGLLVGSSPLDVIIVSLGALLALCLLAFGDVQASRRAARQATSRRPSPALYAHPDFAVVADSGDDMVIAVESGRVRFANAAARRMLGDHIVGSDVRMAIRHPAAADYLAAAADAPSDPVDLSGYGRPGERWRMRSVALAGGRRLVMLTDIAALDAAEAMRADFVANASHELRTPLASIIGAAETLEDAEVATDTAARMRFTGIIGREGRRMQRLVDDLLSVSRIAADRHRAPTETIDLAALARATLAEVRGGGDARAADIVVDGDDAPLGVWGDAAQIGQLIHNLLGNAMKYGRAGTPVTVTLGLADDAMARLTIADEGDGIAPHHLPRLTERFYRVDNARSRALGGTGLGLAIVKHIVERHRGQLDIASVPGTGTRVTVLLPRAD